MSDNTTSAADKIGENKNTNAIPQEVSYSISKRKKNSAGLEC